MTSTSEAVYRKGDLSESCPEAFPLGPVADSHQDSEIPEDEPSEKLPKTLADQAASSGRDNAEPEGPLMSEVSGKLSGDPQQVPDLSEMDVFDKLSKMLAEQAATLTDDDAILEERLRPDVIDAL